MKNEHTITADAINTRLDRFVCSLHPELSRAAVQKFIKQGAVLVNNQNTTPHHFLKLNDRVFVDLSIKPIPKEKNLTNENKPITKNLEPTPEPEVIAETSEYIIINKPAGLIVHPTNLPSEKFTLVDWILRYDPEIKKVGDDLHLRPGIVHRLDQEVSGVMIVAKTQKFFKSIKEQFQKHLVKKTYLALVYGKMPREQGVIELPIKRHTREARMAVASRGQTGKYAYTEYLVLKQFPTCALLKVNIETGRTHQIRAHFHALGHPIVGDTIYTSKQFKLIKTANICLQSIEISFTDQNGLHQEFKITPSLLFKNYL